MVESKEKTNQIYQTELIKIFGAELLLDQRIN